MRVNSRAISKRYLLFFSLCMVAYFGQLSLGMALLVLSNEQIPMHEIIHRQQVDGGLYGTAIHPTDLAYPLVLHSVRKADIAAIGSSRVLQLRGEFFSSKFTNLGRAITNIPEAHESVRRMLEFHRPKIVLFGIDVWWFLPNYPQQSSFSYQANGGWPTQREAQTAVGWLLEGRVSKGDILHLVSNPIPDFGVLAVLSNMGRDYTGSFHQIGTVTGKQPSIDIHFQRSLEILQRGEAFFERAEQISPERWDRFLQVLREFQTNKVPVILFLPPFSGVVQDAMQEQGGYGYIDDLRDKFKTLNVPVFDFTDARPLGATDCEFLDGYHAGPVTYARMLLQMTHQIDSLAGHVRTSDVEDVVARFAGRVSEVADSELPSPEIDFLDIGCPKSDRLP